MKSKMTVELTLDRFEALAAAYGGQITAWPEADQDAAAAFMVAHPDQAESILCEAEALDQLLDAVPAPQVSYALGHAIRSQAFSSLTPQQIVRPSEHPLHRVVAFFEDLFGLPDTLAGAMAVLAGVMMIGALGGVVGHFGLGQMTRTSAAVMVLSDDIVSEYDNHAPDVVTETAIKAAEPPRSGA